MQNPESSSKIRFRAPSFASKAGDPQSKKQIKSFASDDASNSGRSSVKLARPSLNQPLRSDVYLGSFVRTPRSSIDLQAHGFAPAPSPRTSAGRLQLNDLLKTVDADLSTYGVEELRDGFFDASFYRPLNRNKTELKRKASDSLPRSFHTTHPLSVRHFIPDQFKAACRVSRQVCTSRAGIRLLKSFLGFFICYLVCLVPVSRKWLGRYNYIMPISAIINHPGRPVGSQVDGLILTVLGTVAGLGWGSLALYVSTSTEIARQGYGGVIAAFLVIFTAALGWLRCIYLRTYQAVLCAGFAIFYACLAETGESVSWRKVFNYGIPWVLGQAVCLIVGALAFPDAGSRSLALRYHDALATIRVGLSLPQEQSTSLKRDLTFHFVLLSQGVRDFTIEFTFSRYRPDDVRTIRNLLQGVIRSILSIKPNTTLFRTKADVIRESSGGFLVKQYLQNPTRQLLDSMLDTVDLADQVLLAIGGQAKKSLSLGAPLETLHRAISDFDSADLALLNDPSLASGYAKEVDVVDMLLFIHPVRQTADKVEAFVAQVFKMQERKDSWRIIAPSYPWQKGLMRINKQVRHDRGGLTAGFYFQSRNVLERTIADIQNITYTPRDRPGSKADEPQEMSVIGKYELEKQLGGRHHAEVSKAARIRYRLWNLLHWLQGFESRFALKITIVTTLLSVPAWLEQSREWYSLYESWWVVVIVWSQMHPRVGGTFQDLLVRMICAALGALWGGLAFGAGHGNPYVMGVFTTLYMVPMIYRYTQSSHPRSGLVGCLSYTVVSLSAYTDHEQSSVVTIAWTRGLAFVIGVAAALLVNWMFWPFIARHELRKSLSSMMLHSAVIYRAIISNYIYYKEGSAPGAEEGERSEMLEGRLREAFVRVRQLLELTRHEMRLRAPFDPLPYSGLISSCEAFFEHLVQVRQSSLYFQPTLLPSTASAPTAALTTARRDAVAAILMNLYTLACALRANKPIPKYLPSAAAARQRLLDRMAIVEAEIAARERAEEVAEDAMDSHTALGKGSKEIGSKDDEKSGGAMAAAAGHVKGKRRWADVYEYAYSSALTDIVAELQVMKRFSKEICGEVGWY